ncbi:SSrecog-domain-containing protein [Amniculicola lignicola CBS 123094]|uniref:FACT complex subunit POB3 n=1 Tax=Amniculicola lignicola CBS 123094 TaxID=1392246 RepID=A0A6A5WGW0_9PLEO|nr:SSrecog-domain-containing protein [Amniculicola lignicola CBS 123094]
MEVFKETYLNLSKKYGSTRFVESGLGWKPSDGGDNFTLDHQQLVQAQWSRAARGYEVKLLSRSDGVLQIDGFKQEDYERISKLFKIWYGINLDNREHALRGWNWGKAEFAKQELTFNVGNRPAFEVPYTEISNTNLAGKNEVAVDLSLTADGNDTGTNGSLGGARARGKKSGGALDQLVEVRFYIPGVTKKEKEDGEGASDGEEVVEEHNAAQLFYETLMDKAEIGEVAGDTFATFLDILHLTPRGRFDIDMYEKSFRLRGKTYDYKIQYEAVKKFMVLPKPDETHILITLGLDPPLRQGQTRYPFLVMQFKRDEEVNLDLNMKEDLLQSQYKDRLEPNYEAPIAVVVEKIFKGLTGKRVTKPSKDFSSHHDQHGIKCSIKANEGHLFCLDKAFMFVPKPATYISIDNVVSVTMSRVGGAMAASRTFDITFTMKGGMAEQQFSNINREEQQPLENFFRAKNIKTKNEMVDDSGAILAAALQDEELASSDEEVAVRGSADEDDESVDEDFQADSESDVAEEFDENHESDSASDAEMSDAGSDAAPAKEAMVERPKKKQKVSK